MPAGQGSAVKGHQRSWEQSILPVPEITTITNLPAYKMVKKLPFSECMPAGQESAVKGHQRSWEQSILPVPEITTITNLPAYKMVKKLPFSECQSKRNY